MIEKYLKKNIHFINTVGSWEEAIEKAARPLLEQGFIEERYIQAMIESVHRNGSYFVLVPNIAMPHAASNQGALKNGLALLKLIRPVEFPEGKFVNTIIVLSAQDNNAHMGLFAALAELLLDSSNREKLIQSTTQEEILEIIKEK